MVKIKSSYSLRLDYSKNVILEKVVDIKLEISKGSVNIYQVGKRKFLKIKVK